MPAVTGELRVRLLGPLDVEGVDVQSLPGRKARTLLKILALARGRPVAADRLIDLLWGDALPANPERDHSVQVSRVRALLGADRVTRNDAGYALAVDWLDVAVLDELAADARRRLSAGHPAAVAGAISSSFVGRWKEGEGRRLHEVCRFSPAVRSRSGPLRRRRRPGRRPP